LENDLLTDGPLIYNVKNGRDVFKEVRGHL
jgi:hypothetical protein